MSAIRTRIVIPSQNQEYTIPGTSLTIDQIKTSYASEIPGLSSLVGTETTVGEDRIVTFAPRTGTKGAWSAVKTFVKNFMKG